ncbi:hypothetical protein [Robertkochia solimangrovi]|nr:hypothetical protein [Robertkochia solimangrovi]
MKDELVKITVPDKPTISRCIGIPIEVCLKPRIFDPKSKSDNQSGIDLPF